MTPVTIIKAVEGPHIYKVKDMNQCTIGIYSDTPPRAVLHYVGKSLRCINRRYKSVETMLERNDWQLVEDSETQRK